METTPDRIAATSGGDSRYASTSQPWKGKIGALTAKAIRKPRKTQSFDETPESTSENVSCESPKTMIAASISSDPAIV